MSQNTEQLNLSTVIKRLKLHKKLLGITIVSTFILSCLLILPVPRYYNCEIQLAPEMGNLDTKNSLSDIASSFGFNLGSTANGDAIYPDLYPELIKSNDFIYSLLKYKVKTKDGEISTNYYNYLNEHQKKNPLLAPLQLIKNIFSSKEIENKSKINPFKLTKKETEIFDLIRDNIGCSIDIKTGLISISVQDQDPLIAATMADSVRIRLQEVITEYRTSKARRDYEYYKKLTIDAKSIYEKARQTYGSYADNNMDVILESFNSKKNDLENDMQLKFNTYSTLNNQLQAARAKVQENTPAFTTIKTASVPVKPTGPKRMAFVLTMVLLSIIITVSYINFDLLVNTNK